ncbi:MAG: hypothetical protein R3E14_05820 [Erythrobacter sp.]
MINGANKQPISSHPAFRWAVGLWFAALLGAGLFVMPDSTHAAIRQTLHIDGLVPADAIGKAALAGIAALVGLLLGVVLGGRVAALNAARDYDEDDAEYEEVSWQESGAEPVEEIAEEPRRPFSPREYFGDGHADALAEAGETDEHEDDLEQTESFGVDHPEAAEFDDIVAEEEETVLLPAPQSIATPPVATPLETADDGAPEALGDLPLAALTDRLQRALNASRARPETPPAADQGDLDPVIAFLRREADRTTPGASDDGPEDTQAALRSALDRLSKVSNPR